VLVKDINMISLTYLLILRSSTCLKRGFKKHFEDFKNYSSFVSESIMGNVVFLEQSRRGNLISLKQF